MWGDPDIFVVDDSTKAQEILDWKPKHEDIEDIISSAWKWYKNTAKN